jgi:hypothetical protein
LSSIPGELQKWTGQLTEVMQLELTPEKKLARVKAIDVIKSIEEKGFYIQMPPSDILANDTSILSDSSDTF